MKRILTLLLLPVFALSLYAQDAREMLRENPYRSACFENAYETFGMEQTPLPKGYTPFYVSHYGRHGSRYHTVNNFYTDLEPVFASLEKSGYLTEAGKKMIADVRYIGAAHERMLGLLTLRGAREHREIAARMYERFTPVFKQKNRPRVEVYTTGVHRVISSMANFTHALKDKAPALQFSMRSGGRWAQEFLSYSGPETKGMWQRGHSVSDSLLRARLSTDAFMARMFTDPERAVAAMNRSPQFLMEKVLAAVSIRGTMVEEDWLDIPDAIADCFTEDEIYELWYAENARMATILTKTDHVGDIRVKAIGARLLRDIVRRADAAVAGNDIAADLRFGHDQGVLPMLAFLGTTGNDRVHKKANVSDYWYSFRECPMCTNAQFIFARNRKGDVLVKILHNEREVTVTGLEPLTGPWYRWADLRAHSVKLIEEAGFTL